MFGKFERVHAEHDVRVLLLRKAEALGLLVLPVPLGGVHLREAKVLSGQLLQLIAHKEALVPEHEYHSVDFATAAIPDQGELVY